ncbi:MAG: hypothetical protein HKN08_02655 [Gammaproteobacteria bacterium]|nr:hypothetical protein [Gammaproteobacteria bacterium]
MLFRLLSVLMVTTLIGCASEVAVINGDELLEIDGVYLEPDTGQPFTGLAQWHYDNGQLKTYIHYEGGKRNGLNEDFFDDGRLAEKSTYVEGKRNGLHEEFYDNGQLMERRHYIIGQGNGVWEWYSREGDLIEQKYYVNGDVVSD